MPLRNVHTDSNLSVGKDELQFCFRVCHLFSHKCFCFCSVSFSVLPHRHFFPDRPNQKRPGSIVSCGFGVAYLDNRLCRLDM